MSHPLAKAILSGDRTALAKGITLVESTRDDHQKEADALLTALLPHTGGGMRIGISGVPGVGKSTFIDTLGAHAIAQGKKVAVLAIDPSSVVTGGAILGDKTRMQRLSNEPNAFVRPTPSSGVLGGVAARTHEAVLLCEAAGYDVVFVETVGVGQSEVEVKHNVDIFLLLLLPGSGDELQGIKRGIVELADIFIVNKADGDLLPQAKRVQSDYQAAIRILRAENDDKKHAGGKVLLCSALETQGISEAWAALETYFKSLQKGDTLKVLREEQNVHAMWQYINRKLMQNFEQDAAVQARLSTVLQQVRLSRTLPSVAANDLLVKFK